MNSTIPTMVAAALAVAGSAAAQCMEQWADSYGYSDGWRIERHPRFTADVNGDGRADLVAFGSHGVQLSLSTGDAFTPAREVLEAFGYADTWRTERHPRMMADVNGDGRDDIAAFSSHGVQTALSNGDGFDSPRVVVQDFGYIRGGWRVGRHPRMTADVNGDGRADIVGFSGSGVLVSLSTGTGFAAPALWVAAFGEAAGWSVDRHPRMLGDVDGDGRDDVVAFGSHGVQVALSTGNGFTQPREVIQDFGYSDGWFVGRHPRMLADVDGNGRADIVGFGGPGVYVSRAIGGSFTPPRLWVDAYGEADGWRVSQHPRFLADINGDGFDDVVGIGHHGVQMSLSDMASFRVTTLSCGAFGYAAGGWLVDRHPRTMADVDGDGRADVVGFANGGVYVNTNFFIEPYGAGCGPHLTGRVSPAGFDYDTIRLDVSGAPPEPFNVWIFGLGRQNAPLPLTSCQILVDLDIVVAANVRPDGTSSLFAAWPVATPLPPLHVQFFAGGSGLTSWTSSRGLTIRLNN